MASVRNVRQDLLLRTSWVFSFMHPLHFNNWTSVKNWISIIIGFSLLHKARLWISSWWNIDMRWLHEAGKNEKVVDVVLLPDKLERLFSFNTAARMEVPKKRRAFKLRCIWILFIQWINVFDVKWQIELQINSINCRFTTTNDFAIHFTEWIKKLGKFYHI